MAGRFSGRFDCSSVGGSRRTNRTVPGAAIYALYASCVPCPFGCRCEICAPDKFQAQKVHENAILFSKTQTHIPTHAAHRIPDIRASLPARELESDWIGLGGRTSGWVDQRRRCPIDYEMMRFRPGRLIGKVGLVSGTVDITGEIGNISLSHF